MSTTPSHILPTRVVSGLNVTSERCGDVASIIVSRDPHDYIKILNEAGEFVRWDKAALACHSYDLIVSTKETKEGCISATLFPHSISLGEAIELETNAESAAHHGQPRTYFGSRTYANHQENPVEKGVHYFINSVKKNLRKRQPGKDGTYTVLFSPTFVGGVERSFRGTLRWESILKMKLTAHLRNKRFASTYEYPWSLRDIETPGRPHALVCIPYHNSADPAEKSAYDEILSQLGCTAKDRNDLNKFASAIETWMLNLYGTEADKTAIGRGQTIMEEVKRAFREDEISMVRVWMDETGESDIAQLTCTITHLLNGEERKVPILRKPE